MEPVVEEKVIETTETTAPPTPSSAPNWLVVALLSGLCLVVVSAAVLFFVLSKGTKVDDLVLTPEEEGMVWRPEEGLVDATSSVPMTDLSTSSATSTLDEVSPAPVPAVKRKFTELRESTVVAPYDAVVRWLPEPRPVTAESLPVTVDDYFTKISYVGKVVDGGALAGMDMYLMHIQEMGVSVDLYAISETAVVAINKDWPMYYGRAPERIKDASSQLLLRRDRMVQATLQDLDERRSWYGSGTVKSLTLNSDLSGVGGQLYQYEQCFFGKTPSGMLAEYVVDIPFIADKDEGGYGTPSISFNRPDGTYVSGEYEIYDRVSHGCGSLCSPLKVVDRTDTDFVKTGTTADGSSLFVLKDPYDTLMQDLYNQPNTRAFVDTSNGSYEPLQKNKYTYEQFVSMAPLLFWKDQLGRWVKFVHSEFLILAEKCKPVIYLYPEKEMDVAVQVKPNLGFTKTIPEYGNGWEVTATPGGTITDKKTGAQYPYLYWTGWVEGYPLIERGWVVAQDDLGAFFDVSLAKLGLQGREIDDFKEYWKDDMKEAPYYAVTFVDQRVINDLSPLTVSGDPDTLIRVLMTAQPLPRPIPLVAPVLPVTPTRHGFTVVEWGGTILRSKEMESLR